MPMLLLGAPVLYKATQTQAQSPQSTAVGQLSSPLPIVPEDQAIGSLRKDRSEMEAKMRAAAIAALCVVVLLSFPSKQQQQAAAAATLDDPPTSIICPCFQPCYTECQLAHLLSFPCAMKCTDDCSPTAAPPSAVAGGRSHGDDDEDAMCKEACAVISVCGSDEPAPALTENNAAAGGGDDTAACVLECKDWIHT